MCTGLLLCLEGLVLVVFLCVWLLLWLLVVDGVRARCAEKQSVSTYKCTVSGMGVGMDMR